jgi:hypothetical protein
VLAQAAEGMVRYLGDVEPVRKRHPVQCFDINKLFLELNARDTDFAMNERVEYVRIVRARRIADGKHPCHNASPGQKSKAAFLHF